MKDDAALSYLTMHGIKPSVQRMAVMEYLMNHHTHPTADEIYHALHPSLPTLSKTTVYNTLRLLVEQGAVVQVTIDERKVCYDALTEEHAHFLCKRCGKLFDVRIRAEHLSALACIPEGFSAEQSDLYFRGICKDCATREA